MSKFKNYYDMLFPSSKAKKEDYFSSPGESIMTTYSYEVVEGIKMLVPSGETDLQASIDSYADMQDINNIIARFVNGDTSVLNPKQGSYGDFSDVPSTYAELFARVQQCKNVFDNMPVDIREKFDNSYEKFWSDFGSDSFDKIFEEFNSQFGKQSDEVGGISESSPTESSEKGVEDAK